MVIIFIKNDSKRSIVVDVADLMHNYLVNSGNIAMQLHISGMFLIMDSNLYSKVVMS
jgi:hypothetical protein